MNRKRSLRILLALGTWSLSLFNTSGANFTNAMERITGSNSPAHQAIKKFRRGTNLGNYLEAGAGQNWGASYSAEDFKRIKAEGFDHVRLPIAWNHYTSGPEFVLSSNIFAKADFLVTNALANNLAVIVNIHHFDAFTSNPEAETKKLLALWEQIARHYQSFPDTVAFEILNEPKDAATTAVMNGIYAKTLPVIRKSNPKRVVFVGPGMWNSIRELEKLVLPAGDNNLVVTVHCYEPFYFTHQGANWSGPDTKTKGIVFPGPPEVPLISDPNPQLRSQVTNWIHRYNTLPTESNPSSPNAFRPLLKKAKDWSDYFGRPVHVGEFGCYTQADAKSRARFYAEFRKALDDYGVAWAMWDWKAGFRYWDDKNSKPAEGMREALFSKKL